MFKESSIANALIVYGLMSGGILAAIAIPMYNSNVNRAKVQEATDTLDAIKEEVSNYTSDVAAFPPALVFETDAQGIPSILGVLGVAVPQSTGAAGGRKWIYTTGVAGGNYFCVATAGVAADIGSVLAGNSVWVEGVWDGANRVFTGWQWGATTAQMQQWLPR